MRASSESDWVGWEDSPATAEREGQPQAGPPFLPAHAVQLFLPMCDTPSERGPTEFGLERTAGLPNRWNLRFDNLHRLPPPPPHHHHRHHRRRLRRPSCPLPIVLATMATE